LKSGWCVSFNGGAKIISYGWYSKDKRTGNYMEYNAKDMTQIYDRCGWYEDDKKVSNLETGARKYKAAYPK